MVATTGFNKHHLIGILFISISHYIINCIKLYVENKKNEKACFFIDQLLHLAVIAFVINEYQPNRIRFEWLLETKTLALAIALIFTSYVTAIILKIVLAK